MPAYVVANVHITDPDGYAPYRAAVPASIEQFGGRYLARGGKVDVLEGDWIPSRLVIVEFPDAARARAWWESQEYAELKAIRQATTDSSLVVVDGV